MSPQHQHMQIQPLSDILSNLSAVIRSSSIRHLYSFRNLTSLSAVAERFWQLFKRQMIIKPKKQPKTGAAADETLSSTMLQHTVSRDRRLSRQFEATQRSWSGFQWLTSEGWAESLKLRRLILFRRDKLLYSNVLATKQGVLIHFARELRSAGY